MDDSLKNNKLHEALKRYVDTTSQNSPDSSINRLEELEQYKREENFKGRVDTALLLSHFETELVIHNVHIMELKEKIKELDEKKLNEDKVKNLVFKIIMMTLGAIASIVAIIFSVVKISVLANVTS